MARLKQPKRPDPGTPPEQLLRFDEAQWADDAEDARFLPGGEFAHPGLLRFRRKSRWHQAQEEWSVENGLHRYHLLNASIGARKD